MTDNRTRESPSKIIIIKETFLLITSICVKRNMAIGSFNGQKLLLPRKIKQENYLAASIFHIFRSFVAITSRATGTDAKGERQKTE